MMTTATAKTKRAERLAPDAPDEPKAPTSAELRVKIDAAERRLAEERAALGRVAQARQALFASGATEESVVEHDAHSRRLEIRVEFADSALKKLREQLANAEAIEADDQVQAVRAEEKLLAAEYERRLRKIDTLAQQMAIELQAAAEIERHFAPSFYLQEKVQELQEFRDDRPRQPAEPAHIETIREEVIDRDPVVGYVGQPGRVGPRYVTRERQVIHPARAPEDLPPLSSIVAEFKLPALSAEKGWHWGAPVRARLGINEIYA